MASFLKAVIAVGVLTVASAAWAGDARIDALMADRVLGEAKAPVKIDEYVSMTCTHCAEFYTQILPTLEERYVKTGKAKFIVHDFPLDGASLKASAIARCMPADEFYPFIKILYGSQAQWAFGGGDPETRLIQYAKLGGLPEDRAKACANDTALQNAIVAAREDASQKMQIDATPTFVIDDGAQILKGSQSVEAFSAVLDKQLAGKKTQGK